MAFLIRHSHVNAENEPKLAEIEVRLHRKHDLFVVRGMCLRFLFTGDIAS
jgi:hypothetical protein